MRGDIQSGQRGVGGVKWTERFVLVMYQYSSLFHAPFRSDGESERWSERGIWKISNDSLGSSLE